MHQWRDKPKYRHYLLDISITNSVRTRSIMTKTLLNDWDLPRRSMSGRCWKDYKLQHQYLKHRRKDGENDVYF